MANPDEGQVAFDAGGKTYTLEITNRTERALQKRFNHPMRQVITDLGNGDIEAMLGVFVEALKKHHPDVDEETAIDLVRPGQLRDVLSDLISATYRTAEDENPQTPGQDTVTGSAN